jgi:hypothetical protein
MNSWPSFSLRPPVTSRRTRGSGSRSLDI